MSKAPDNPFPTSRRILYAVALIAFGALAGTGAAWVAIALCANSLPKAQGNSFIADSLPKLALGAIIGAVAGLIAALYVLNAPSAKLNGLEHRFIGGRGTMGIYSGVPILFMVLLFPANEPLAHKFGDTIALCILLGLVSFFAGLSLFFYDRIPRRFIIPIGLLCWLLTFTLALWYSFLGPGAFSHH